MFNLFFRLHWSLLAILLLAACGKDANDASNAAAMAAVSKALQCDGGEPAFQVNGESVPKTLLDAYLSERGLQSTDPAQLKIGQEKLAEFIAINQVAIAAGFAKPSCQISVLKANAGGYVQSVVSAKQFSEAELKQSYDSSVQREGSQQYLVSHLMFTDVKVAKKAAEDLSRGVEFAQLIKELNGQPQVSRAASLGWITPAQLPAEVLQNALRGLQKGQSTAMLSIQGTWHFLKVDDIRQRSIPDFAQVKPQIERQLRIELAQQTIQKIRDAMKIQ